MASPESVEAAEFVRRLVARGISQKTIGAAVGRNDSLISQIRRGTGKGGSLRDRLAELVANAESAGLGREATPEQLAAGGQAPPRRVRKSGTVARVRRAVSVRYRGGGSTSTIKAQAAHAGGNGLIDELRRAAGEDLAVAFHATFKDPAESVQVLGKYGDPQTKKRTQRAGGHKRHGVTVALKTHARDALDAVEGAGSVTLGVLRMMMDEGVITYADEDAAVRDLLALEMRVWGE